MGNIQISFKPKQKHLDEIAEWMIEEKKTPIRNNANWPSIINAFEKKNLVIATHKNKAVGFYTLSDDNLTVSISVAEVDPNYRKKGIGKLILKEIIKNYAHKEVYALKLFCAPRTSHKIWKKLGFKYFPNNSKNDRFEKNQNMFDENYGKDKLEMYKIIKPYLKPRKINPNSKNEIREIWNNEPLFFENKNPTWTWNLKYIKKTNKLEKPIVHFGCHKWRIRWRKENEIYKDCKFKHFDSNNSEFSCMIIKEMPKIK